ncbi:efflux RND transporter periplasmic adaptor subunit [Riemerella columbipharyngis]|uniref:Membrane fusion protein, multidrug efflux system n=1 Tax=Riemerella columbipharyngis TaxID=1071918 RepID=A0A1G6Y4X3_9FLAO|nr:efflux RND transporter periplasmic adaptor subunit [Riemerella columbipharyngis]SDD85351.1 membrane fusion protein, multidrug efflux system [Riemerella columbipharyngis]
MKNIIIITAASVALLSCNNKEQKQDAPPATFPVVEVAARDLTGYTAYPASIRGIVNNDVRAKIQGYITQVLVDEGQRVTKGQPLFRLETNVLTENADAAKASVAAARASVQTAQVEVNKLKPLVEKGIISKVSLQTAEANLAMAKAQLQQAQANYKGMQANVDYSVVRAPISGVVGSLPLKAGSLVGPSDQTPLTTISDTKNVYAYFGMNEKEYFDFLEKSPGVALSEKIKNLPMVDLQLANGQIYPEKGKIETVTGQINSGTGTIQFRAGFANPQNLLSNGNSGNIRIPQYYDNVLVVPESATFEQQGIVYVYKVADGKTQSTVITVKARIGNMAIVESGLKAGDMVVATGTNSLRNDTKIVPKKVQIDSLTQSIKPIF